MFIVIYALKLKTEMRAKDFRKSVMRNLIHNAVKYKQCSNVIIIIIIINIIYTIFIYYCYKYTTQYNM